MPKPLSRSKLKIPPGTDLVKIGSARAREQLKTEDIETATMEDVSQIVGSVKFLVRNWIPYGMVTLVVAPPGVGKSAFALGALAGPIILGGRRWFNLRSGPKKPGYVLWADTEGGNAISIKRLNDWGLPSWTAPLCAYASVVKR